LIPRARRQGHPRGTDLLGLDGNNQPINQSSLRRRTKESK